MARRGEQRCGSRNLDDPAEIHDAHAVRDMAHGRQVVADEQIGQPEFVLQVPHQVQDLRLDRNIERRGRLVANQEFRIAGKGAGNRNALALAAGKLVRILLAVRRRKAHLRQQAADPLAQFRPSIRQPECPERLRNDVVHPPARVEAGIGVLEDHLHPAPAAGALGRREPGKVQAVEQHAPGSRAVEAHDQPGDGGLPATGLADERQRFPLRDRKGNAVHGLQKNTRAALDRARKPGLRDIEMPRDRLCGNEVSGVWG